VLPPSFESRRDFLKKGLCIGAVAALPNCSAHAEKHQSPRIKTTQPQNAVVLWYSQTGNTRRIGQLIAGKWRERGISVTALDIREIDPGSLQQVDLIVLGSPVFYMDVPLNVRWWLNSIPEINGIPVAAYVTYGGTGHNQHNTACSLLERLQKKGGVPMGITCFSSMSSCKSTAITLPELPTIFAISTEKEPGPQPTSRMFEPGSSQS